MVGHTFSTSFFRIQIDNQCFKASNAGSHLHLPRTLRFAHWPPWFAVPLART
jgi:hypothetical protein